MSKARRVALITGGGRGIGLGIAESLAAEGYNLAICGLREEALVEDSLAQLRQLGAEVLYCRADVADADARRQMLAAVRQRFDRLDVLVNNAGVAPKVRANILEATEDDYEWLMRINLQGPYFLTQSVANWMIEQRRDNDRFDGCIVNISSISATIVSPDRGAYCISKAGIGMATQLWAAGLGEFGIPVYEVRPGLIKSDMTKPVTEKYDKLIAGGLLVQSRWGLPEDVGRAVAMLARGDCAYSTGQVIMVDGGMGFQRL